MNNDRDYQSNNTSRNYAANRSLCYSADIVLNGKTIATADTTVGPFIVREYVVDGLFKEKQRPAGQGAQGFRAKNHSGELEGGAIWEDNFFSLVPHETRTVLCRNKEAKISIEGWNL